MIPANYTLARDMAPQRDTEVRRESQKQSNRL